MDLATPRSLPPVGLAPGVAQCSEVRRTSIGYARRLSPLPIFPTFLHIFLGISYCDNGMYLENVSPFLVPPLRPSHHPTVHPRPLARGLYVPFGSGGACLQPVTVPFRSPRPHVHGSTGRRHKRRPLRGRWIRTCVRLQFDFQCERSWGFGVHESQTYASGTLSVLVMEPVYWSLCSSNTVDGSYR